MNYIMEISVQELNVEHKVDNVLSDFFKKQTVKAIGNGYEFDNFKRDDTVFGSDAG